MWAPRPVHPNSLPIPPQQNKRVKRAGGPADRPYKHKQPPSGVDEGRSVCDGSRI